MKPLGLTLALLAFVAAVPAFGDRYRHHDRADRGSSSYGYRHDHDHRDYHRYYRDHRDHRHDDRRSSPRTYPHAPLAKPNPPFHPKAYGWKPPY
jgi:hypothetical protein